MNSWSLLGNKDKVVPFNDDLEAHLDQAKETPTGLSKPKLTVEQSLASIRSHRSADGKDEQDDTAFHVTEWLPGPVAVIFDGYALFNLFFQCLTGLFFLAIAYDDGLGVLAVVLTEFVVVFAMVPMYIRLADTKGKLFVYLQLLDRKVLLDLVPKNWVLEPVNIILALCAITAFVLLCWACVDYSGPAHGGVAAAFSTLSALAILVTKSKGYLQQEKTLVPLNYIIQDDPVDRSSAPTKKAWVNELTVVQEEDFYRYVRSRAIKAVIDPSSVTPMPEGRDKWDLIAAEILADPQLTQWPALTIKDVQGSDVYKNWTRYKQLQWSELFFQLRYGSAMYFGTVQFDKKERFRAWVVLTAFTTFAFLFGSISYAVVQAVKQGSTASCTSSS